MWAVAGTACWLTAVPIVGAAGSLSHASQVLSDPVSTAVDDFYSLQFDAAQKGLDAWLDAHPDDLRALSYRARVSLQREMLRRELLQAQAYGKDGEAFRSGASVAGVRLRQEIFGFLDRLDAAAQTRLKQTSRDGHALYWLGAFDGKATMYLHKPEDSNLAALGHAHQA